MFAALGAHLEFARVLSFGNVFRRRAAMPTNRSGPRPVRRRVNRREFMRRAGWGGMGATALALSAGRGRSSAQIAAPYPDWIPVSSKPPKRGGTLTRASAWDPPVIDPRLTQSVGLFQFVGL